MEFPRTRPRMRSLPLTAMIDIVFILIIFFMLTTHFVKIESMELILPAASGKKSPKLPVSYITLANDGRMFFGKQPMEDSQLEEKLLPVLSKEGEQRILLLVEDQVPLQTMVEMMDRIYIAGGKNVFVRALPSQPAVAAPTPPAP